MRPGEGSARGVLAFRGRGISGRGRGGSVLVDSGVGSGSSREAGGFITTPGLGGTGGTGEIGSSGRGDEAGDEAGTASGRGGAGNLGTGGRSENRVSSSIPMTICASCNREARTETFFRKHAPGTHGQIKAKGNPSAGSSSPCCCKGSAIEERWGKHTLTTSPLIYQPSSPTEHSELHSLYRTISSQKDYYPSISNI